MTIDKKINYEMQGNEKPARNYLGKQKTVTVPIKWKSNPKAPKTELAYITKAEKNLLIKNDIHGSLKKGPNTGPSGIMSLDSQGDYTRDRSENNQANANSGSNRADRENAKQVQNRMKDILTGNISTGQTSAVSDRTRRGAMPEVAYGPDGQAKMMYSQKAASNPQGFFGKLFSGNNQYGYRDTYNNRGGFMGFGGQKDVQFNPKTGRYEFEEEETGNVKPSRGGQILGGLAGLATGIPFVGSAIGSTIDRFKSKPKDMSSYNKLGLFGQVPEDFELGNQKISDTSFTQGTTPTSRFDIGNKFFDNNPEVKGMMNYGITETQPSFNTNTFTNDLAPNYQDMAVQTRLTGLALAQQRNLEKAKGMQEFGGTFTNEQADKLNKLNEMDKEETIYSKTI